MSLSDIPDHQYKKKKRNFWKGNVSKQVTQILTPSEEVLFADKFTSDGEIVKNLSMAKILIIHIVGGMSSGKSILANYIIDLIKNKYGEERTNIRVSRDIFALIGKFDKDSQRFYGGAVTDQPIQVFVHDDALSQLGKNIKKSVIDSFDAIFNNTRHLVKYKDENGNKRGLIIVIFNSQDYYLLNRDVRGNWALLIYKTIMQNPQHYRDFKAQMPKKGMEILEKNTDKILHNDPDETFKNDNVVNFGYGRFGEFKSKMVQTNYCDENGPYWLNVFRGDIRDDDYIEYTSPRETITESSKTRITTSGEFKFTQVNDIPFPLDLLDEAFKYGKDTPFISGGKSKYKKKPHWYAVYDYLVKGVAAGIITENLGLSGDSMLTNGYSKGGYVAIVVEEQLGHWVEQFVAKFIKDIDWNVITGQAKSDLKDDEAFRSNSLGYGIHGEIKCRRKRETPEKKWLSTEMISHMAQGGKGVLYQLIVRRNKGNPEPKLLTFEIQYTGEIDNRKINKNIETIPDSINSVLESLDLIPEIADYDFADI